MNKRSRRITKTKTSLKKALKKLLFKDKFSTITIREICQEARVHRTTFYQHYKDKEDLLNYLLIDLTEDYQAVDFQARINHPFTTISRFTDQNLAQINNQQKDDPQYLACINNLFISLISKDFEKQFESLTKNTNSLPSDLIAQLFTSVVTCLQEWNEDNFKTMTARELDQVLLKFINIELREDINAESKFKEI